MELRPVEQAQRVYAQWLERGTRAGYVLLVVVFALYVLGMLVPHVPLERLPELWRLSAAEYQAAAGAPAGWGWLGLLHRGDYLNYLGVVLLVTVTAACYLRVLPLLGRERAYFWIAVAELVVLAAAASGLLAGAH